MAKKQFKAESKRLLDLMINSIYTHKEIFLREVVSNASDAIDKLCYLALTDENVGLSRDDFRIRISVDKEGRTVTVSDNGIGMNKSEMESNLGVIARSGSLRFKSETEAQEKSDLDIGKVQRSVCEYFNISREDLLSKSRKRQIVQARQIAMYLSRNLISNCSLASIGQEIGGKDHATVLHACSTVSDLMATDKGFRKYVTDIEAMLVPSER